MIDRQPQIIRCPYEADAPHDIEFAENGSFVCKDCRYHGDAVTWLMSSRGLGMKEAKALRNS